MSHFDALGGRSSVDCLPPRSMRVHRRLPTGGGATPIHWVAARLQVWAVVVTFFVCSKVVNQVEGFGSLIICLPHHP